MPWLQSNALQCNLWQVLALKFGIAVPPDASLLLTCLGGSGIFHANAQGGGIQYSVFAAQLEGTTCEVYAAAALHTSVTRQTCFTGDTDHWDTFVSTGGTCSTGTRCATTLRHIIRQATSAVASGPPLNSVGRPFAVSSACVDICKESIGNKTFEDGLYVEEVKCCSSTENYPSTSPCETNYAKQPVLVPVAPQQFELVPEVTFLHAVCHLRCSNLMNCFLADDNTRIVHTAL